MSKKNVLTDEELDALGQESEKKAAKWVKEFNKERLKKEDEEENKIEENLKKKAFNENLYNRALMREAKRRIASYPIPSGYYIDCQLTSKGIAFGYKSLTDKMWFMRGMKIVGNPLYDLNGIEKKINEALDEIDMRIKGKEKLHKTASGVILPN